eukprot:IDg17043t1
MTANKVLANMSIDRLNARPAAHSACSANHTPYIATQPCMPALHHRISCHLLERNYLGTRTSSQ